MDEPRRLLRRAEQEKFFAHVAVIPFSTCWHWTGTKNEQGYGIFQLDGRPRMAHRVSYCHHVGPIPAGLHIDHRCRVRHCVNPRHIEPVTCRENVWRGQRARRGQPNWCEKPPPRPFTEKTKRIAIKREHDYAVRFLLAIGQPAPHPLTLLTGRFDVAAPEVP